VAVIISVYGHASYRYLATPCEVPAHCDRADMVE
jgi:hypothetical protein